ncbi:MAG: hypothetical protein LBR86_02490 [Tannerella sp.]|nr:hypothetical protein [Tannerella sp.]
MLLTAVLMAFHVSFAVHYCCGYMASVRMYGKVTGVCCCGDENVRPYDIAALPAGALLNGDASCCSDKIWAMITDDCQDPPAVTVFKPTIVIVPFVFDRTHVLPFDGIAAFSAHQIIFPPGGFPASGIDLLTQICILRI